MGTARFPISELQFISDPASDVAFAIVDKSYLFGRMNHFRAIPCDLTDDPGARFIDDPNDTQHAVIGYPNTKNFARRGRRGIDARRFVMALILERYPGTELPTTIANALAFKCDRNGMINADGINRGTLPQLVGMSGGPVLSIRQVVASDGLEATVAYVAGVACQWHGAHSSIVATPVAALRRLADRAIVENEKDVE